MSKNLRIDTGDLPWSPESAVGVERKLLAAADAQDRFMTSVVRLAAGAALPATRDGWGRELIVLEGELLVGAERLRTDAFLRQPVDRIAPASTGPGCSLFVKEGPLDDGDREAAQIQSGEVAWLPGHGNLTVKPLHSFGTESSALVHWPAGERFLPHQHWGGEEIFVLSGTFMDEHGEYPAGTWLRSPHLSSHHPFVVEETVIFVKTGHLKDVGVVGDAMGVST